MRLVIARCQVDYAGKLTAHLPMATRLLVRKADGSVLVHSDGGSYKPLNWMNPPCTVTEAEVGGTLEWTVTSQASGTAGDTLRIIGASEGTRVPSTATGIAADAVAKGIPPTTAASSPVQARSRRFMRTSRLRNCDSTSP